MKTSNSIKGILLGILFLFPVLSLSAFSTQPDSSTYVSYQGFVKNAKTNELLSFASITLDKSSTATVSNIDGEFTIKVDNNNKAENLNVRYIGFKNKSLALSSIDSKKILTIELEPVTEFITELTIRPTNAAEIISNVLRNISLNYSTDPVMMTGFYRETVKNRRDYVSISEAVVDIYKSPYNSDVQFDQVKIDRGRKSTNVTKMDTLLVKMQGGPTISLMLDIVKNPYTLFTNEFEKIYEFNVENLVSINDRLHYVIGFKQRSYIDEPYFFGKFYIEIDRLAISEIEFSLNLDNKEEASRIFIKRKPAGVRVTPLKTTYRAIYTIQDNKWFFNYGRAEVKFKLNWKKKLFNTTYSLMSEIAITDRNTEEATKINRKARFNKGDIMEEEVNAFFDPEFWGDYNLIEPDESIEQAIKKLYRQYK